MRGVGMGKHVWRRKNKRKKKEKKRKRNVWMQGKKVKLIKRIKKSQLNVTIIFSQYFTINFK